LLSGNTVRPVLWVESPGFFSSLVVWAVAMLAKMTRQNATKEVRMVNPLCSRIIDPPGRLDQGTRQFGCRIDIEQYSERSLNAARKDGNAAWLVMREATN
jgi:hypothetical protein